MSWRRSLALVKLWGDWDWAGAEREYKRALELNPNFVRARIYYAEFLSLQKRFEEALREIKRAEEADPASLQALGREGYIHYQMRQHDRAIEVYRKILGLRPNRAGIQRDLALALSQQGRHQEAIAEVSQFQTPGLSPSMSAAMAYIYNFPAYRWWCGLTVISAEIVEPLTNARARGPAFISGSELDIRRSSPLRPYESIFRFVTASLPLDQRKPAGFDVGLGLRATRHHLIVVVGSSFNPGL